VSNFNLYLFLLFMAQLFTKIASTGSMISFALSAHQAVELTAIVVSIQVVASTLALLASRKIQISKNIAPMGLVLSGFSSLGIWLISSSEWYWFCFLFCYEVGISLALPYMVSLSRNFANKAVVSANKKVQTLNTFAIVITLGVSPLLVNEISLSKIFMFQSPALLLFAFLFWRIAESVDMSIELPKSKLTLLDSWNSFSAVYLLSFFVCLTAGLFNIIEIPVLNERFQVSATQVSSLFLATAASSLLAVTLFPTKILSKKLNFPLIGASVGLTSGALVFLYIESGLPKFSSLRPAC
jgi:hypothetical protein